MDKKNKIGIFYVILALFISIPILLSDNIHSVEASTGGGDGKPISNGIVGTWYFQGGGPVLGSGHSDAWKAWRQKNRAKIPLDTGITWRFNNLSHTYGYSGADLESACKRSRYIWWYAMSPTDPGWAIQIGDQAHPSKAAMKQQATFHAGLALDAFFNLPNHGWDKPGGTVIICSGTLGNFAPEPKQKITITGGTKYFLYNGKQHRVTSWSRTSGSMKSGHIVKASALGTRTAVGNSAVKVGSVRVENSSGTTVTSQYDITKRDGRIYVRARPKDNERCVVTDTQTVTGTIQNDVTVAKGFLPAGAPNFATIKQTKTNNAYTVSRNNRLPSQGDSLSTWNNWKNSFNNGAKDLSTQRVNLEGTGVAQILAKHGGVLNVTRTHHEVTVTGTICQPQVKTPSVNDKGDIVWSGWKNVGGKEVSRVTRSTTRAKNFSYQILGVNCNVPGFNRVSKSSDVKHSYGDGTATNLLETREVSGINFPLGRSGETATNAFYNDGPSCKDKFVNACTSKKLGSSAQNDADNNNNAIDNPLFTHEDPAYEARDAESGQLTGHGYANGEGELVFFRDNEDRTVRAEVFYPKRITGAGLDTYPDRAARATVTKTFGGSPEADITSIYAIPKGDNPSLNKNLIDMTGKEDNFIGHVNKFNMKSEWASKEGNPWKLGVDWIYEGEARNNMVSNLDGYKVTNTRTHTSPKFDVHCQFMNDKGSYDAQIPTNPFIKTRLDEPINWDSNNVIRTIFTRSVSDAINPRADFDN